MKKLLILILGMFFYVHSFAQELTDITGRIVSSTGSPLEGVTITNEKSINPSTKKNFNAITDKDGKFSIKGIVGDVLHVAYIGFHDKDITVAAANVGDIPLEVMNETLNDVVVTGLAVSSHSVWLGAKLGYNFDGINDPNNFFVGAAKVEINPLKSKQFKAGSPASPYFSVIGNIANFINSNTPQDSIQEKLSSLALSTEGVGVGLGLLWEFKIETPDAGDIFFRPYLTSGYRLNTYTKVGPDTVTVNLSQFRNTVGIEFEGLEWKNGGAMNLSFEGAYSLFDPDRYATIFSQRKKSLATLEASLILPISKSVGFFVDGTYAKHLSAVYLIGAIIKTP
jgi:hypothetical protein